MNTRWIVPLLAAAAVIIASGCAGPPPEIDEHDHDHDAEETSTLSDEVETHLDHDATEDLGIELAEAGPGTIHLRVELPGEVQVNGDRMVHVSPRISGVAVEVLKSLGDEVSEGELLGVLDSRELADLHAEYLAAVARLDLARASFEREQRLRTQKVSSEQDYLDAENARSEARINLRSTGQKLAALGFSKDQLDEMPRRHATSFTRYPLTAPFGGMIIDRHLTRGESVAADTAIFTIADLSTVWIDLKVYQRHLGAVHAGQEVVIQTDHGHQASAVITFVQPLVEEDTRTALARIKVANTDGHWHPGCFVTAQVTTDVVEVPIAVPIEAVIQLEDGDMVVFVEEHEEIVPHPVELGRRDHESVEVLAGLNPGQHYVVRGAFTLKAEAQKGSFGHGHEH